MSKNIITEEHIKSNINRATYTEPNLIKQALEHYADKRYGENTEENVAYRKNLENIHFMENNTKALMDVSIFLYSICYSKDKDYDLQVKEFIENIILKDNEQIKEMKIFLIKNHEYLSDVSLLNEVGIVKYFKRIDNVILKCHKI